MKKTDASKLYVSDANISQSKGYEPRFNVAFWGNVTWLNNFLGGVLVMFTTFIVIPILLIGGVGSFGVPSIIFELGVPLLALSVIVFILTIKYRKLHKLESAAITEMMQSQGYFVSAIPAPFVTYNKQHTDKGACFISQYDSETRVYKFTLLEPEYTSSAAKSAAPSRVNPKAVLDLKATLRILSEEPQLSESNRKLVVNTLSTMANKLEQSQYKLTVEQQHVLDRAAVELDELHDLFNGYAVFDKAASNAALSTGLLGLSRDVEQVVEQVTASYSSDFARVNDAISSRHPE